jgi:uncharacterized protein (TIGR01777 family)
MKVLLAGGSGFLGRALAERLAARGDEVVVLTRRPRPEHPDRRARDVLWAPGTDHPPRAWQSEVHDADAIVNLAGAGIADRRWTSARKRLLRTSRLDPTRALVSAVRTSPSRPAVFIQGSAIGYYGSTLDDVTFDESSPPGQDFLGSLCEAWEAEARLVEAEGVRLVTVRTGLALAADGGVLEQMARPFRLFVGGPVASGRQELSWIHRDDWVALTEWALDTTGVSGPINASAPSPATNAEFSAALGRALHRPNWAPVPGFVLRLLFGELADALLITGQRAVPTRARELGFEFAYSDLDGALRDIYP